MKNNLNSILCQKLFCDFFNFYKDKSQTNHSPLLTCYKLLFEHLSQGNAEILFFELWVLEFIFVYEAQSLYVRMQCNISNSLLPFRKYNGSLEERLDPNNQWIGWFHTFNNEFYAHDISAKDFLHFWSKVLNG